MTKSTDLFNNKELQKIKSIERRLNRIGRELKKLDLILFGWSGSGCIIRHDDGAIGGAYKVVDLIDIQIDGGDPSPAYENIEEDF